MGDQNQKQPRDRLQELVNAADRVRLDVGEPFSRERYPRSDSPEHWALIMQRAREKNQRPRLRADRSQDG